MQAIDNSVKVYDTVKKMRMLMDEIAARGGFIPGNIELVEDAVAELDELLNNDAIMNSKALSSVVMEFAPAYRTLRKNYERMTNGNH